jgi:hypothetical protein
VWLAFLLFAVPVVLAVAQATRLLVAVRPRVTDVVTKPEAKRKEVEKRAKGGIRQRLAARRRRGARPKDRPAPEGPAGGRPAAQEPRPAHGGVGHRDVPARPAGPAGEAGRAPGAPRAVRRDPVTVRCPSCGEKARADRPLCGYCNTPIPPELRALAEEGRP